MIFDLHSKRQSKETVLFVQIKVRRNKDSLKISAPEISSTSEIQGPIKIFPLGKLSYFEQRQAFNILAWLKTPYGIMIGFVILAMVVMPFLKIDQQEYQQIMNERRQASQQQQ